jgi:outer membrane immunogenic protein
MGLRVIVGAAACAASLAVSLSPAAAADLSVPSAPAPVAPVASAPAAIYNWTGFYIGGNVGGGFTRSSWSDPFGGANNVFNSGAGFLGGAQVGANYQWNRLVFGVEGDFNWTSLNSNGLDSLGDALGANVNWTSTVTGRIGGAFDRLLIYAKGGAAFAQGQYSLTDLAGNFATSNFVRSGWTVGAGLEYGISKNWSAKIEYDYLAFGPQPFNFATPLQPAYATSANLGIHEIKAGVNFRFGGP